MPDAAALGGRAAVATRPRLLLDISRTVARARLPVPTGIDRVERAHIDEAMGQDALFLCRVGGEQFVLGPEVVRALLGWLEQGDAAPPMDLAAHFRPWRDGRLRRAQALVRCGAGGRAPTGDRGSLTAMLSGAMPEGGVLLNVGHDNLDAAVLSAARAAGLPSAVLIHDVIPLDHPQFARPGSPQRFRTKLDAACGADLIVCNSRHTRQRLAAAAGPLPPVVVAPLGVEPPASSPSAATSPEPYFVCLGTIEPRKNHALLLGLWQRMWEISGEAGPRLHIVGRRGWRNAPVFRTLDSAPMMGRTVYEHGQLDDSEVSALTAGARALLFPSFAEGFGLPLAEALALGTPVLASDLPALREVGGDVPDWLEPADAEGWRRAVADYAAVESPRREAQLSRLRSWRAPRWQAHFRIIANALETCLAERTQRG